MSRADNILKRIQASPQYAVDVLRVEVSEQIFLAMERDNVSRAEIARRLGVSRATVTQMLRGTSNFTLDRLANIGRALNGQWKIVLRSAPCGTGERRIRKHIGRRVKSTEEQER